MSATRIDPVIARECIGDNFRRNGAPYSKPFISGVYVGIEAYCAGEETVRCPYNQRTLRADAFMAGVMFARGLLEKAEADDRRKELHRGPIERHVGEAFSAVLISVSEPDLSKTAVLGQKLVAELLKRGLTIAPLTARMPRG